MDALRRLKETAKLKALDAARSRGLQIRRIPAGAIAAPLTIDLTLIGAYLSATRPLVVFVQVGAFDGQTNDPLHDMIRRYGWRGVFVEPQPYYFGKLRETYADVDGLVFLNAAVATEPGTMTLWSVADSHADAPDWVGQIASFDREHVLRHVRSSPELVERIVGEPVEATTLADIFAKAPGSVDVLQVDAEGYDAKILNMLDLTKDRPTVIRFEHSHLDADEYRDAVERLVANGYRIAVHRHDTLAMLYTPGRGSTATT